MRSKEVETAIKSLNINKTMVLKGGDSCIASVDNIETVLAYIEELEQNSVSKDKIRALEKEYSIRCAVLSRSATPDQWYSMGRNIGRTLAYQELLEVE